MSGVFLSSDSRPVISAPSVFEGLQFGDMCKC
jgi:hypothetical protein